jgi:hypothetical protein
MFSSSFTQVINRNLKTDSTTSIVSGLSRTVKVKLLPKCKAATEGNCGFCFKLNYGCDGEGKVRWGQEGETITLSLVRSFANAVSKPCAWEGLVR